METKKNPNYDLEGKRGMFLNLGLVISLSIAIMAFEWRTDEVGSKVDVGSNQDFDPFLEIPLTRFPPPPKPKPIQPVILKESIEEVEEPDLLIEVEVSLEDIIPDIVFENPIPEEEPEMIYTGLVETMPEPEGGLGAFFRFVAQNLKYPNQARRIGIQGKVFVQFVVDKDGSLTDIEVIKGIGGGCDKEALRVMSIAPAWKPGKQRGRPVKVRMVLPFHFKLD